jgi:NAD+ kinase
LLTSKTIMGRGFPLYGINTGHLGFLASGEAQSAVRDMRKILERDYSTFPRIPLKGEIVRDGRCVQCVWALNEVMVVKSFVSRPIALSVHMGNGKLYSIQADGIIAATPTGSTAYALSAGGPIVHPGVRCAVVIPVCPHSLYPRPLVIPDTEALRIKLESPACGALLSGDGQDNMDLAPGDEVVVTSDTEKKIDVVSLGDETYADVLRGKLNWS